MKIASLAGLLSLALFLAAPSAAKTLPGSQIEMSMLVSGTVKTAPNGNVTSYSLDQAAKLPDGVKHLLAETVPNWIFEPVMVHGKRMPGTSHMYLRLVAKPLPADKFAVSIAGARFGKPGNDRGVLVSYKHNDAPNYPKFMRRAYIGGTVFLLVRVNRSGHVAKVAAEQVNLDHLAPKYDMKRYRDALARATELAAKSWTFNLPTAGSKVDADHWDVRVPVTFTVSQSPHPRAIVSYGKWRPYVPGPQRAVAWRDAKVPSNSIDALPAGKLVAAGAGRELKTSLAGS